MNRFTEMTRLFSAGSLCLIAACSETPGAANEEPVDPAPGLYEIAVSGAGLMKHAGKDNAPHSYCLKESERSEFPHMMAENYVKLHPACTTDRAPRQGNRIAGEIKCMADPKMAEGANSFLYKGDVAEDAVKVEFKMKFNSTLKDGAEPEVGKLQMKLAMKALEQARFLIEATQIGDCG